MVLVLSILMFIFVMSVLYLLGMKFWLTPQNVVDRVMGEVQRAEQSHPSLAFRDALEKLGNLMPASPTGKG